MNGRVGDFHSFNQSRIHAVPPTSIPISCHSLGPALPVRKLASPLTVRRCRDGSRPAEGRARRVLVRSSLDPADVIPASFLDDESASIRISLRG